MTWSSGYVSEIDYTYGYYRELSPGLLRLACLSAGIALPAHGRLQFLELGFGQGLSINIHAAADPGKFWGTDFNPMHAAHARSLAEASGSGAVLLDDSFAELAARSDLPEFDMIGVHGIWTWISDENRRIIIDLIRRKLRVGGLLYISYNCLPGWAPAMPLRHLMTLHADIAGSEAGGIVSKIDGALSFAKRVVESGALYFRANPAVVERLNKIGELDRHYLAHEYFNRDWDVMPFSDVVRWLDEAKLTFVTSAHLVDHVEAANLTADGMKFLSQIRNPVLYQSVRDYLVNQQFRRDIFIKGPRRLSSLEQTEQLLSQSLVLIMHPSDITFKTIGALGEISLQESIYKPIIEALAEQNFAPKTVKQLSANEKLKSLQLVNLLQALVLMVGAGFAHPAQQVKEVRQRCTALNRQLCERARSSNQVNFLASPVTGSGHAVNRIEQLLLLAAQNGKKTIAEQAEFVWGFLAMQGHKVLKDGKPLETPEQNVAELTINATSFAVKRLPILKALGIA